MTTPRTDPGREGAAGAGVPVLPALPTLPVLGWLAGRTARLITTGPGGREVRLPATIPAGLELSPVDRDGPVAEQVARHLAERLWIAGQADDIVAAHGGEVARLAAGLRAGGWSGPVDVSLVTVVLPADGGGDGGDGDRYVLACQPVGWQVLSVNGVEPPLTGEDIDACYGADEAASGMAGPAGGGR